MKEQCMKNSFQSFAEVCDQLAATASKLKKRALMTDYLVQLDDTDAGYAALYLAGSPFSESDPRALNTGGALLSRVLRDVATTSENTLHAAYRRHGDLGAAAYDLLVSRAGRGAAGLTLADVRAAFDRLAVARGVTAKEAIVRPLLVAATPLEAKYLIKLMLGDMRIGVKESQVEEAIAATVARKESGDDARKEKGADKLALAAVRHAGMLTGNVLEVVVRARAGTLDAARLRLFHALGFMLATPAENVEAALERFTKEPSVGVDAAEVATLRAATEEEREQLEAAVEIHIHAEDKYDGIRCQLHCGDPAQPGRVALFSRTREDMTESFPEITNWFSAVDESLILDGELLAWDTASDRALPFSALQPRIGRKRVTEEMQRAIPVVFLAFDVLYAGGELLLDRALTERRCILEEIVTRDRSRDHSSSSRRGAAQESLFETADGVPEEKEVEHLRIAPCFAPTTAAQLDDAFIAARTRGNEGLMLKAPGSHYQPGRRGSAWVKLKRELATLDVVVTAAEYGHGRRAAVLSDVTFAVKDGDQLLNVGKAYSGLTDAEIAELTQWFTAHTTDDLGSMRLVEPQIVMEVAFNNVTRSDRHNSGFALRFPRILRLRPDKPAAEIDTLARVGEIYEEQPDKPRE